MSEAIPICFTDAQQQRAKNTLLKWVRFTPNGCWEWMRSRTPSGYGKIAIDKVLYKAHRVSYSVFRGEVPTDLYVCHTCDNPCCVNPDHLFLGTNSDNIQDCLRKGRHGGGGRHIALENRMRGGKSNLAVLTEEQVASIRAEYKRHVVTYKMLAKKHGVCKETIANVIKQFTWKQ